MKKYFENFNFAAQALSSAWEKAPENIQKILNDNADFKYPFDKDFNEVTYEIHTWCEDMIEFIESHGEKKFCVYRGGEWNSLFEDGWFYEASVAGEEYNVVIFEGINSSSLNEVGTIEFNEFKEKFYEIPEELYRLYEKFVAEGRDIYQIKQIGELAYNHYEVEKILTVEDYMGDSQAWEYKIHSEFTRKNKRHCVVEEFSPSGDSDVYVLYEDNGKIYNMLNECVSDKQE